MHLLKAATDAALSLPAGIHLKDFCPFQKPEASHSGHQRGCYLVLDLEIICAGF